MSDAPFHQTRMGRTFYESTLPALVTELRHIAGSLRQLVELLSRRTPGDGAAADEREEREGP